MFFICKLMFLSPTCMLSGIFWDFSKLSLVIASGTSRLRIFLASNFWVLGQNAVTTTIVVAVWNWNYFSFTFYRFCPLFSMRFRFAAALYSRRMWLHWCINRRRINQSTTRPTCLADGWTVPRTCLYRSTPIPTHFAGCRWCRSRLGSWVRCTLKIRTSVAMLVNALSSRHRAPRHSTWLSDYRSVCSLTG